MKTVTVSSTFTLALEQAEALVETLKEEIRKAKRPNFLATWEAFEAAPDHTMSIEELMAATDLSDMQVRSAIGLIKTLHGQNVISLGRKQFQWVSDGHGIDDYVYRDSGKLRPDRPRGTEEEAA
jgi:hypothetical protein